MPTTAQRMKSVQLSSTVQLSNLLSEMRSKGEDIISFSVGEPDFTTAPHVIEAAREALNEGFTKYTPSYGIEELREAIAEKSREENDIPCERKNVLVTPSKHAIFMTCLALVEEGEEVLLQDPCWVSFAPCVQLAGGKPVFVKTSEEDGFEMNPESISEKITNKTKMIIVNTPSNPTGTVYSKKTLKAISDLAQDHDFFVLSDEIYGKIVYEGEHHSIASFNGMFDRTVTVNGFSKTYAMTGWRLGWLIAPPQIFKEIIKVQEHSVTCATSFAQKGGVVALTSSQKLVDSMVREFKRRRDLIVKGLNSLDGFECLKPKGAFYAFPRYHFDKSSNDFANFLLQEAKIAVTPGTAFGTAGEKHLRFSYATSMGRIKEGLQKLEEVLHKF